jgi:outer membrane immunogenic protein
VKKMFSTVAVATAALVAVTPATAQNFTGVRGEIRAGWDRVSVEDAEIEFKASKSGVTYGAGLGYDFALGAGLIAGAEADFDLSSTWFHVEDEDFAASIRARRDIEISARLGAVVSKNVRTLRKGGIHQCKDAGRSCGKRNR